LRIESKVLVDKGVLGGCWEEVLLLVFMVLWFIEGNVGEGVKAIDRGRGDRGTGNNILRAVRDVEEGKVFNVVKSRPDKFRGLRDDRLEDTGGNVKGTWVVPSIVRALKDFKDGSGGIYNVLLIDVVKGRPGSNRDVGEGRGGDSSGLRSVKQHLILN